MKKKIAGLMVAGVVVFTLSGCGGGGTDGVYVEPTPTTMTLMFIDDFGDPIYKDVPYTCYASDNTLIIDDFTLSGEFTTAPGERCVFDFTGFNGTMDIDPTFNDYIYIVDNAGYPKQDIYYTCDNYIDAPLTGRTYADGGFDYYMDAQCEFSF